MSTRPSGQTQVVRLGVGSRFARYTRWKIARKNSDSSEPLTRYSEPSQSSVAARRSGASQ
mgnify:CR=1 FL=1